MLVVHVGLGEIVDIVGTSNQNIWFGFDLVISPGSTAAVWSSFLGNEVAS